MYSKKAWGGATDPFILVKFLKDKNDADRDPGVGLVIWEWNDYDYIWKPQEGDDVRGPQCEQVEDEADVVANRGPTCATTVTSRIRSAMRPRRASSS